MTIDVATDLVRESLTLALLIAAPLLLAGLAVGVVVSVLQALTQIQEQTLVFVPKIVAMVAVTILMLPWITQQLVDYIQRIFRDGFLPLAG